MDPGRRVAVADALRERAEHALADVEATYGPAPRREPLTYARDHDPDAFPRSVAEQVERLAGIAGALVTDDAGRAVCVDVNYTDAEWQTPSGAVDPGDSLAETAYKEVREETGPAVELTGLLYTRQVAYDYGTPEPATLPMVVFTARRVGGETRVPERTISDGRQEIADVRWFSPENLPETTLDYAWIVADRSGEPPPE